MVTIEPSSEASLDRCLSSIGFMDLKLDEIQYDRTWGDQFTERLELAECEESIVEPNGSVNVYQNHYVLYGRVRPSVYAIIDTSFCKPTSDPGWSPNDWGL